jgi:hypothetical protein
MIELAWRFLRFQSDSALAQWFKVRTTDGRRTTRKTMIVALTRKLLIACGGSSPLASCRWGSSCARSREQGQRKTRRGN